MDDVLRAALQPVLRDVDVSGAPAPEVADEHWDDYPDRATAILYSRSGHHAAGVAVFVTAAKAQRVASVADMVQDWVVEELWMMGLGTNWPRCPNHPDNHPLRAQVVEAKAMWCCPNDASVLATVGALSVRP